MGNVAEMRVIVGDSESDGEVVQRTEEMRILEALLFAAEEPLDEKTLASRLPEGTDVRATADAIAAGIRLAGRQRRSHRGKMDVAHGERSRLAADA